MPFSCLAGLWSKQGKSNAEWHMVVGAFALADVAVPHVRPAPEVFSKLLLKELLSRGSHQCLTFMTAAIFYVRDYFSMLYSSTQRQ